jgi:hypothetical protein
MWIRAAGQINLCARHVKETLRVSIRKRPRFFDIDDVVGDGSDAWSRVRIGAHSAEGSDDGHREPSIIW